MTPEGRIKREFNKGLAILKERYPGKLWVRMPVSRGFGLPWLDYHLCAAGQTIAIEAKRDVKHKFSPQQEATARDLTRAGALVLAIYDHWTIVIALEHIEKVLSDARLRNSVSA